MTSITDRYAGAINSKNLRPREGTDLADVDVLGGMGIAGKARVTLPDGRTGPGSPLGAALLRLFLGDGRGADAVVQILARMARDKADTLGTKVKEAQRIDIARAVLSWHRDGRCPTCTGHGFEVLASGAGGRATLTDRACRACAGTGRVPFDPQFRAGPERIIAQWLAVQVQTEQQRAGGLAMAAIRPSLSL